MTAEPTTAEQPPAPHRSQARSGSLQGAVGPVRSPVSYLLRVVLPDRPGMLGAVATAIGEARTVP